MFNRKNRTEIQHFVVTAKQMQAIETRLFDAGMPVAALMEKVAGRITQRILSKIESIPVTSIGVIVGPGHNGGDALVVARELHFLGYSLVVYCPFSKQKELTQSHLKYITSLGILINLNIESLQNCDVIIDGMFGFGLERPITDELAEAVNQINAWKKRVLSIDLPSGIHTDTGEVLGTAINATDTFCLGLWKLAFLQDSALDYLGNVELIDFDIPLADIQAILGKNPEFRRITKENAIADLPLPRPLTSHKYKNGNLLIVAGSHRYTGAAILAGLGARASGVGMLSIAVPNSIKPLLSSQLPEALIVGCPETEDGAILDFPSHFSLDQFDAIACGPGLTQSASTIVQMILDGNQPLILDADGLNILAQLDPISTLSQRQAATVITPHPGEFKRLFPDLVEELKNRILVTQKAAQQSQSIVLLKGARVCIGTENTVWMNPESTPALARGGSGDVLTGLLGGLLAAVVLNQTPIDAIVKTAVWWHAQAGIKAAKDKTELGVDAFTLTQYLNLLQLGLNSNNHN
ncbi:NAD(P)H-hydrate dehydratase [Limnoraphis robusta Tam1]|uniref:NAD(P)H-hydrate dehydratase n=1 Tax=Limnoraphis robusta TaxID=1118279 RepID=UPI002B21B494|nr:NAD(P)H-hydrate dehydratase [Limnoraphis robusta]MEA5500800.1 NAD(P)H-hydrate dehydratase [Limnoraphis robusta BA-68 BA1]MEA5542113.1 NAD(P)H-hydrate dehydratase [Limnoraphis robusta Tam1]